MPSAWKHKPLRAAERLRELAREAARAGDHGRLPAERDLVRQLALSRRFLQQALHILEACFVVRCEHGRGNFAEPEARWLALPEPGAELLLVRPREPADATSAFMFAEFQKGIEDAVAALSARLTEVDPAGWRAFAAQRGALAKFRGALLIDPPGAWLAAELLDASAFPVAGLEHDIRDLPLVSVADGSFRGTYEATEALVRLGHRRIAFLDREDWEVANPAKFGGYQACLAKAGLAHGGELARRVPLQDSTSAVSRQLDALLELPDPPTALLAYRDSVALLVLRWLQARGLTPGAGLSVIGSGDQAYRRGLCRTLASIRIHYRRMGEVAALEALCGRRSPEMRTVIVPNRLKLRGSVGPATAVNSG